MKVKKRKEKWEAEFYDGTVIPERVEQEFGHVEDNRDWGNYFTVSKYNADQRQWEDWDVHANHWLVWSSFGKVKVLDQETFEEKYEEDD